MKGVLPLLLVGFAALAGAAETKVEQGKNDHRLVRVPGGEYALGSADHRFNKPHRLKTAGFLISDAETTNAQFAVFVKATGYQTRAEKTGWSLSGGEGSAEWEWKARTGDCLLVPMDLPRRSCPIIR